MIKISAKEKKSKINFSLYIALIIAHCFFFFIYRENSIFHKVKTGTHTKDNFIHKEIKHNIVLIL